MPNHHVTSDDRNALQVLMASSGTVPAWFLARILGKHVSSIYRELSRNAKTGFYLSHHADTAAQKRRQGCWKRRKRLSGKDKRGIIPDRVFIDNRPTMHPGGHAQDPHGGHWQRVCPPSGIFPGRLNDAVSCQDRRQAQQSSQKSLGLSDYQFDLERQIWVKGYPTTLKSKSDYLLSMRRPRVRLSYRMASQFS